MNIDIKWKFSENKPNNHWKVLEHTIAWKTKDFYLLIYISVWIFDILYSYVVFVLFAYRVHFLKEIIEKNNTISLIFV